MDLNNNIDVRMQIAEHLKQKGIMKKWLAEQLNVSAAHLGEVLSAKRTLTSENLTKINKLLNTHFDNGAENMARTS